MDVTGSTRVLGIIGDPIGHTLSPEIHRLLAKACKKNTVYLPFRVKSEDLRTAMEGVRALGILGLNVTVPHKMHVIPFLDACTDEAKEMGAVNTVRNENGRLVGHNTDGLGFLRSLLRQGISLAGMRVAVLGAGGAASGICTSLGKSGVREIFIVNRTWERGEALADFLKKKGINAAVCPLSELSEIDLLINTTSVGMIPHTDEAITTDFSFMKQGGYVYDAVYAPRETKLLEKAREAGLRTVSGIGMLIEQAVLSYEFFTGGRVPEKAVSDLYDRLSFPENIILTGFMGSGKSTVGKCLAQAYSLSFADTDRMIEKREGKSVKEIFKEEGEAYFRKAESAVVAELSQKRGTVISLGGGAVVAEENRKRLKESGRLIYLEASPGEIMRRVGNDETRPLLFGKNEAEIYALLDDRLPAYRDAHARVVTDGKTPEEIVAEIVEIVLTK